ncbi:MAG TPA: hypothetical protein VK981_14485 [Ramlibacter sp.]|nr:hypothetical protein [Ramlibacter sp.]
MRAAAVVDTSTSLAPFFAWAAQAYPQFFNGSSQDGVTDVAGLGSITFRHFDSGNYVGVGDAGVYAYGWVSGNTILRVGALNDFVCNVYPGNHGCADLSVSDRLSGTLANTFARGDHTIYLQAGRSYFFRTRSTEFDTYLSLYSPQGQFLTASDDLSSKSTDSGIGYAPLVSGLYRLAVNSAAGSGAYTIQAYFGAGNNTGGFVQWVDSANGPYLVDPTDGEAFAIDAATNCLYSFNREMLLTDFCLHPVTGSGNFGGQPVRLGLVSSGTIGVCYKTLTDSAGYVIDIDLSGMVPVARPLDYRWQVYGCT